MVLSVLRDHSTNVAYHAITCLGGKKVATYILTFNNA
ncbi:hypothetical protein LINPERPRIM_LOCUS25109 [Linum perenne]